MSRNGVTTKRVKTAPDGSIENQRPTAQSGWPRNERSTLGQNIVRPSEVSAKVQNSSAARKSRPGKVLPAVGHATTAHATAAHAARAGESFGAFWSIWDKEHGGTWHMEAAQLDTQRKKGEAILKTSSTTRPTGRVPQLDRPSFNSIELRSQSQTRKMLLPP
ncbi:unnamed protein product [Microthlaspi erraticum]|uniref:Uncharacterized protein n=1 Tax=Microthlaspi erraticum TaxID=1685480 RepID=A0A6D2HXS2_9BRAS|nr:unnamed protein product [Microthlaspi erraticum]